MPPQTEPTPDEVTVEEEVVHGNKVSVKFGRKVSDGNFGVTETVVWVENEIPTGATAQEAAEKLTRLLNVAKATTLDHLGIAYHYDQEAGVVREDLSPVTQGRVEQAFKGGGQRPPSGDGRVDPSGIVIKNPDEASPDPIPEWAVDAINKSGVTAVFDRRQTRDDSKNQPYFVEFAKKGSGKGKDGSPKSYWPPR
jgi:hypothetical protein